MKQISRIVWLFTIGWMFLTPFTNAQTPDEWEQKEHVWKQKAADAYEFPVKPGTADWIALESTQARVEACQIPEETLKTISTEGLVETCLNFPFFPNIAMSDNPQNMVERVASYFNGLHELLRRPDAGTALLERYQTINPEKLRKMDIEQSGEFYTLKLYALEVTLAHDTILAGLPENAKFSLLQEALRVYRAKQRSGYGNDRLGLSAFIMAKILEHVNYQPLKQRISSIEKEDVETLKQKILQKRPDMRDVEFTPIPRSGPEKYQDFLQSGGFFKFEDVYHAIVLSAEQYLEERRSGREIE